MKITPVLGILSGTLLLMTSEAQALTLVPPNLSPGSPYRLVFVTSTAQVATSSNINTYNTFVDNTANGVPAIAAVGVTWTAIGSTNTVDAINNTATTGIGVPIYRLDGVQVANDYPDLWDGTIANSISVAEDGTNIPHDVWTGTNINGLAAGPSVLGNASVALAGSIFTNNAWIFASSNPPTIYGGLSFYGISDTLIVPFSSTPEPNSLLGCITTGGLMLLMRYRGRGSKKGNTRVKMLSQATKEQD
jgi:hypothetical protein